MSPPLPSIGAPPLPVASSRIPPSSGRREGDSFDPASRRAPQSLLLFASSGRRDGDSFDRMSCSMARRGAPPLCCSYLRRPGGAKETCTIARLVRLHVVARSPAAALVVCVVRAAQRRLVRPRIAARPPARVRKVVGGRDTRGEGGIVRIGGRGMGRRWARRKWVFYRAWCMRIRTSLGQKKTQGKIRAMQWHGQVMPPCHCIAKIAAEARGSCR